MNTASTSIRPVRSLLLVTALAVGAAGWGGVTTAHAQSGALKIAQVEPTPLFPKPSPGQPLKQVAHLNLENAGAPVAAVARISVGGKPSESQDLGTIAKGKFTADVLVPDMTTPTTPTPVKIEIVSRDGTVLAAQSLEWQPQKKWTLLLTSYCHQDLGFGDYPHRVRTTVRFANINWPLKYCTETDNWPDTDKYRWNIESSEPLDSYIGFYGKQKAKELAQRIREGRITIGQEHTTVNSEWMNEELLAREFYNGGRLMPDKLNVPRNKSILLDDVVGFSSSFPTYAVEAGCGFLFHGYNFGTQGERWTNGFITDTVAETELGAGKSLYAPGREAACWFEGADGQKLFALAVGYSIWGLQWNFDDRHETDKIDPKRVEHVMRGLVRHGWPATFDYMLLQDAMDFNLATRKGANRVHVWNQKYEWPKMVTVTMDQYSEIIAKEVKRNEAAGKTFKTFSGDNNDQWADQKPATARLFGQALRANAEIPATEKLATIAQALAGGTDGHADLQNAYSRLLQYHEHTDGAGGANMGSVEEARYYETHLAEYREEVAEAIRLQAGVRTNAIERLNQLITRPDGKNIVVFNPMAQPRTDIFKTKEITLADSARLVDVASGESVTWQRLPEGEIAFVVKDVPATGYRVYRIEPGKNNSAVESKAVAGDTIENEFYRLRVNPTNGAVVSLVDKALNQELVETNAAIGFNEYLYMMSQPTSYPEPTARYTGSARMTKADNVVCARGPLADVVTISGKAGGVNKLRQTIILYHGIKKIDFSLWVDKAPAVEREQVFVSLPLAVPDFSIHHGVPGAVVEPYRRQIEGSSTAHYGIQRFTDLSNEKFGVTISPEDSGLVCYGEQQTSGDHNYNRSLSYPKHSRVYLYLMDNVFSVNIARDQRGPCAFHWSLRSHAGDWKAGGAAEFGAGTGQPLVAWRADGANKGALAATGSFLTVEAPNVICTTVKPAESNGRGVILRFSENSGVATTTRVTVPFLGRITSANETSLVEDDRDNKLPVTGGNSFTVTVRPFGVTTVRVVSDHAVPAVPTVTAQAVADMQVNLRWTASNAAHYNIYRDTDPKCAASPLNFVGETDAASFADIPATHPGGLRSTLEPSTTYYYRVVPVDRWNNSGASSAVAKATTLSPAEKNLPPVKVQGLIAILVSERSSFNFINVMFHTSAESDVAAYEIYRSTQSGFAPGAGTQIGKVGNNDIIKGGDYYGHIDIDYPVREFDHATFLDQTVDPGMKYYYKVRAVDTAGQAGECSDEAAIRTKGTGLCGCIVAAQSTAEPRFGPALALDGNPDPYFGWISQPYGGGTKAAPKDVWWSVEFPKALPAVAGVKIYGDHRGEIPVQTALQVQVRESGVWKTVAGVNDAPRKDKDLTIKFPKTMAVSALRIFVPAADLPKSIPPLPAYTDGYVRICELKVLLPDGSEENPVELFNPFKP
jgi:hypothetical protein